MYPILLTIGTWKLHANLFFFFLSCVVGVAFGIQQAKKIEGLPSYSNTHLITSFTIGIGFAYLIGRLNGGLFIMISQDWNWRSLALGGLISFGAILGGMLYAWLVSRIFKFSTWKILDVVGLIMPLAESIYRIGCILNGCCYGRETIGFGGVYLPEIHGVWAHRYPTQIILLIFNLVLFLWLWKRSAREIKPGSQIFYFMIIYHIGRFFIDFLRGDMPMAGALGFHQIESIILFSLTILYYWLSREKKKISSS